jgi:hypothetical protein
MRPRASSPSLMRIWTSAEGEFSDLSNHFLSCASTRSRQRLRTSVTQRIAAFSMMRNLRPMNAPSAAAAKRTAAPYQLIVELCLAPMLTSYMTRESRYEKMGVIAPDARQKKRPRQTRSLHWTEG